jgi:hypothetical protein
MIQKPKDTHHKTGIHKAFVRVAGYKISIQNSVEFLYFNRKISEKEIRKIIPFIIATKH